MKFLRSNQKTALLWLVFFTAGFLSAVFLTSDRDINVNKTDKEAASEQGVPEVEPLRILFGGDIFLDRSVRRQIEAHDDDAGYPWQNIESFLKQFEYKVANLEGPVVNRPRAAPTGSFSFAFQEDYVAKLKDLGFSALSLANNHTLNQGQKGLDNSRIYLEKNGIAYFGDPNNLGERSFWTTEWEGKKLAFVGKHDLIPDPQSQVLAKIVELKSQGYFVVVFPHWGAEYISEIPVDEQNKARELIDMGADLIIGAHPHVVQPIEIYKHRVIFYSLGNFLFDQGFSSETMQGLLVEAVFEEDNIKFILYPTEQNKTFQVNLASTEARHAMLDRISAGSVVSYNIKESIKSGEFAIEYAN